MSFHIQGVRVELGFGFFAAAAVFSLADKLGLGLSMICGCVIHECGHILAALLLGRKIISVSFGIGGIRMTADKRIMAFSKDIAILLSGPAFNLAAAAFYYKVRCYAPFSVNIILGLYNLLPFHTLDGGSLLELLLEFFGVFSDRLLKFTAVLSGVLICAFLYFTGTGSVISYITVTALIICEFLW